MNKLSGFWTKYPREKRQSRRQLAICKSWLKAAHCSQDPKVPEQVVSDADRYEALTLSFTELPEDRVRY